MNSLSLAFCFWPALATLEFKGGTDTSLLSFMQKETSSNVAVITDPSRRWSRKQFSFEDSQEKRTKLIAFAKAIEVKDAGLVLGSPDYPESILVPANRAFLPKLFPKSKIKVTATAGLYSAITEGPVEMNKVFSSSFSKGVEWHWFYDGIYLETNISRLKEKPFLSLINEVLGSSLIEKKSSYYLDFDPKAFRKRTSSALIEMAAKEPKRGGRKADFLFSAEAFRIATDQQIYKAYDAPVQEVEVELALNSNQLRKLAIEKLKDRFPIENDGVRRSPADYAMWEKLGPALDLSKPPKVIINPTGNARAVFYGEADGKPIRIVI